MKCCNGQPFFFNLNIIYVEILNIIVPNGVGGAHWSGCLQMCHKFGYSCFFVALQSLFANCYQILSSTLLCLYFIKLSNHSSTIYNLWGIQGCQPVRNFRILYGFYMQNTGVRIWPRKYGNWALSVLSLKVLLPEQSLPVLGSKSVRICGILCLRTFKYLFNHQNIQSSLFHM